MNAFKCIKNNKSVENIAIRCKIYNNFHTFGCYFPTFSYLCTVERAISYVF